MTDRQTDRQTENVICKDTIEKLLNGEPTTVYHRLTSPKDFEGFRNDFHGGYKVEISGKKTPILYTILSQTDLDTLPQFNPETLISINIPRGTKVFDARKHGGKIDYEQLVQDGYDGIITSSGVGTPLSHKFMLVLFNGPRWAKLAEKVYN